MKYLLHSQPAKQSPLASARWPQLYTASRIQTRPRGPSGLCSSHSRPQGGGGPAVCDNSMLQQGRAGQRAVPPRHTSRSSPVQLLCCPLISTPFCPPLLPAVSLLRQAMCNCALNCTVLYVVSFSLSLPTQQKLKSIAFICNLQTSFWNACMKAMTKEDMMNEDRVARTSGQGDQSAQDKMHAHHTRSIQVRCDDAC